MKTTIEIPNLDASNDPNDLIKFANSIGNGVKPNIFPKGTKRGVEATKALRNYAWNKATAMKLRLAGKIETARQYEQICDTIYQNMPEIAKVW